MNVLLPSSRSRSAQKGMALIAALFIIVVLAALTAFAVHTAGAQQQTYALQAQNARALAAAKAGIEWAAYAWANTSTACPKSTSFALNQGEFASTNFTVNVSCPTANAAVTDGPNTLRRYRIVSQGVYGVYGSPDYSSRTLTAICLPTVISTAAPRTSCSLQ